MHDKVTVWTQISTFKNSSSKNEYLQTISVTLTFEVGMLFFNATNFFVVVDICAKLFKDSSMHDKVTVHTLMCLLSNFSSVKCYCDIDLSSRDMAFRCDTSS
jgi:hypothetical protein